MIFQCLASLVFILQEIQDRVSALQDVALAIIRAVFANGYVNNKVLEFVGDGIENLSADFRIGIDVMTTETTCLSSIWKTDDRIKEFYEIHGRSYGYRELNWDVAYYDGMIRWICLR